MNASIPDELALWGNPRARRLAAFCERRMLRSADRILVLAGEQIPPTARRAGISEERFRVAGIGARLPGSYDPAEVRRREGVPEDRFLVGFAGNLAPVQGVARLLDAVARLDPGRIEVWVIGTGTQERELRGRAARLAARVRFFGGVEREEADRLLAACHLLVAPYERSAYERISGGGALSSKILTYLASGRPVLVSDLPSYSWIEEIGAGERVDTERPEIFAERLNDWIRRWAEAGRPESGWPFCPPGPGRRFVEEGRTWEAVAERVESILREAADRGGAVSCAARRERSEGR